MVKLHFETTEEFEKLFSRKTKEVTDAIVDSISKAMNKGARTAVIFEISFEQVDMSYEISLPSSQWVVALEKCLEFYHNTSDSDNAIDTWKLMEAAKVW